MITLSMVTGTDRTLSTDTAYITFMSCPPPFNVYRNAREKKKEKERKELCSAYQEI